mmetsp:Transcript_10090/g.11489  ORF Transcript_10090/g.11489 Transcript_10090/m.11489 type:complete len:109 (+) Transcript_10090:21-347(+)
MEKQKLARSNKDKEIKRVKKSKRIICVTQGDIMGEKVDVVCNSIGTPAKSGFGGAIGTCVVRDCGREIIQECHDEACELFANSNGSIPIGEFVSTSACSHKDLKFVLH